MKNLLNWTHLPLSFFLAPAMLKRTKHTQTLPSIFFRYQYGSKYVLAVKWLLQLNCACVVCSWSRNHCPQNYVWFVLTFLKPCLSHEMDSVCCLFFKHFQINEKISSEKHFCKFKYEGWPPVTIYLCGNWYTCHDTVTHFKLYRIVMNNVLH